MVLSTGRRLTAAAAAVAALAGIAIASAPAASAHPLGNFTVNYYSGILVEPNSVKVALVVDRAEIPTLQAFPDVAPGRSPAGADTWRASQCGQLAGQASLSIDGSRTRLLVTASRLEILKGSAGLATSRLECTVRTSGSLDLVGHRVTYQAAPTSGRVGWHEVTAAGNGTTLAGSDVPARSVSQGLRLYPQDLLTSPLDQRAARFDVRAGSGRVVVETAAGALTSSPLRGLDSFTSAYTELVSRTTLTPAFALLAILLSVLLGGLHAFAPGHGKTLMAAYLVGREGTWRQAAVIGVSVTVTHTIGVLLLGVALSAAALAAPEQVYPWLGLISGILLAGIGVTLMRSARTNRTLAGPGHTHGLGGHTHGPSTHPPVVDPDRSTVEHVADTEGAASVPLAVTTVSLPTAGGHGLETAQTPGHDYMQSQRDFHSHTDSHTHSDSHSHTDSHTHSDSHSHTHSHTHSDSHLRSHSDRSIPGDGHVHVHAHGQMAPPAPRSFRGSWRLAAVGLAGGLVPSPSALLVLLGGIALGRAWFGALLVLFYGIGMAAALVGTGLLLVLARDRFERWGIGRPDRRALPGQVLALRLTRALPVLTATAVISLGAWIAVRSLMTI